MAAHLLIMTEVTEMHMRGKLMANCLMHLQKIFEFLAKTAGIHQLDFSCNQRVRQKVDYEFTYLIFNVYHFYR